MTSERQKKEDGGYFPDNKDTRLLVQAEQYKHAVSPPFPSLLEATNSRGRRQYPVSGISNSEATTLRGLFFSPPPPPEPF